MLGQTPSQRELTKEAPGSQRQGLAAPPPYPAPASLRGPALGAAALAVLCWAPGPLHAPLPGPHRLENLRAPHSPPPPGCLAPPPVSNHPSVPTRSDRGRGRGGPPRAGSDRGRCGAWAAPRKMRLPSSAPTARPPPDRPRSQPPRRPGLTPAAPPLHPAAPEPGESRAHWVPRHARPARAPRLHLPAAAGQMLRRRGRPRRAGLCARPRPRSSPLR